MTRKMTRYAAAMTFVLGLGLLASGLSASAAGFSYQLSQTARIPHWPNLPLRSGGLALADFNGDTMLDAVVAGMHVAGVDIILNHEKDVVPPWPIENWTSTGATPIALAAADLDADGDTDLAVAEQDAAGVAILVNDGSGNMTRTVFVATGQGTQAVVAADMDKDGLLDLVVANRFAETVVVLRHTALGFGVVQTIAVTGEPNALAAADLTGDTWPDLAVACAAEDCVKILVGSAGPLAAPVAFEGGPYPVAIAAADLNGDGKTDLAVANREAPQVTVLLQQDAATPLPFAATDVPLLPAGYGAFDPPTDVQLADANYDGSIDIRCAGKTLLNDGTGNFTLSPITQTWPGAVYAQTVLPSEPSPFTGVAWQPGGTNKVQVKAHIAGDTDMDGQVDALDLLTLAESWSQSIGHLAYDAAADFNMDGTVDVTDLLLLAGNWSLQS